MSPRSGSRSIDQAIRSIAGNTADAPAFSSVLRAPSRSLSKKTGVRTIGTMRSRPGSRAASWPGRRRVLRRREDAGRDVGSGHEADVRTGGLQLLHERIVATIDVLHALDRGVPLRSESG